MTTERLREDTQISTRITNEATGIDFTVTINGSRNSRTLRDTAARAARPVPVTTASRNPPMIRSSEDAMDSQNSLFAASFTRADRTVTGDTRSISCPIHILTTCQIISHTATAHIFIFLLFLFFCVVEVIVRQFSSYRLRILFQ